MFQNITKYWATGMRLAISSILFMAMHSTGVAQENRIGFSNVGIETQNADYRLRASDEISVKVFDEPDLTVSQRIDGKGLINVPLLNTIKVSGLTIREVESLLESEFISKRLLRNPQVSINVTTYSRRSFHVFGEVRNPGIHTFPNDADSLDIIEVISLAGDFTDLAQKDKVKITRKDNSGNEKTFIINAKKLISGEKTRNSSELKKFLIYADDIIFVPERFL